MNFKFTGADKLLHFILGALIALAVAAFAWQFWPSVAFTAGLVAAIVAGCAKEAKDYLAVRAARAAGTKPTHTVDPLDLVATILGGAVVKIVASMMGW